RAVLHGPAGLDIGAEGPVEIAWAIMGEILAVRRGKKGGFLRDRKGPESLREYDPPPRRATGQLSTCRSNTSSRFNAPSPTSGSSSKTCRRSPTACRAPNPARDRANTSTPER